MLMIFLSVFSIFCSAFFLQYQTYILVIEIVIHSTGVVFVILEVIIGLVSMIIFFALNRAAEVK